MTITPPVWEGPKWSGENSPGYEIIYPGDEFSEEEIRQLLGELPAPYPFDPAEQVAAADIHDGAMVALLPYPDDAEVLALPDGDDVDQLHVTILYLGDAVDIDEPTREAILEAARGVAARYQALDVRAFGVAMFNPDSEEPAIVLNLSGDGLTELHDILAGAVRTVFEPPEQHDPWVAHLTLIYSDRVSHFLEATRRVGGVRLDAIRVAFGGVNHDLPLGLTAATFHLPGQHDQSSHGKGGSGHKLPSGWRTLSRDEAEARYVKNHHAMAKYEPERIQERLDGASYYAYGEHHVLVSDADQYSQEQMDDMFATVAHLTDTYPSHGGPASFHIGDDFMPGLSPETQGISRVGIHNDIRIRSSVMDGTHPGGTGDDFMPAYLASEDISLLRYVATHEYGHGLQPRVAGTKLTDLHDTHKYDLNPYGQRNEREGFAEAFTEFDLSGGTTTNEAALGYADALGW